MKKLKITNFTDGGHGWYAVKRELLKELNILDKITYHSYQKGQTVYLEEDCDASTFFKAYAQKMNVEAFTPEFRDLFDFKQSYSDNSPVRNYARFTINKVENIEIGMEVLLYGKQYTVIGKTLNGKQWLIKGENTIAYRITKTQEDELIQVMPTKLEQSLT